MAIILIMRTFSLVFFIIGLINGWDFTFKAANIQMQWPNAYKLLDVLSFIQT